MWTLLTVQPRGSITIRLPSKIVLATVLAFGLSVVDSGPVLAAEVEFLDGQVTGYFDTTLSVGVSVRVQDRDDSLIGIANGGTATTINGDDGNLNYDTGVVSNVAKIPVSWSLSTVISVPFSAVRRFTTSRVRMVIGSGRNSPRMR